MLGLECMERNVRREDTGRGPTTPRRRILCKSWRQSHDEVGSNWTVTANTGLAGACAFFAYDLLGSPERLVPFGVPVALMAFCTFLTWVSSTVAPLITAGWRYMLEDVRASGTPPLLGLMIGFLVMYWKLERPTITRKRRPHRREPIVMRRSPVSIAVAASSRPWRAATSSCDATSAGPSLALCRSTFCAGCLGWTARRRRARIADIRTYCPASTG